MDLVAVLDAAQDGDGVLDRRLLDEHHLEAPLEGLILFEVLLVLVERRRADGTELAPCEGWLENVGRVHRALAASGADERVDLIDEQDDLAVGLCDVLHDGLESVLELAAVLGARDERAEVEREDAFALEALRYVALHDADGEALGDGRLAHARLADEHGVVLGAPREDLEHAPDLVVAPDHGVDLALGRGLVEVARVAVQRVVLGLRVGVRRPLPTARLLERLEERRVGHAGGAEGVAGRALARCEGEQQVLGRHELVVKRLGAGERVVEDGLERRRDVGLGHGRAGDARQRLEGRLDAAREHARVGADTLHERAGQSALVGQESAREVRRVDALVRPAPGDLGRPLHGLLGLDGKLLEVHSIGGWKGWLRRPSAEGWKGNATAARCEGMRRAEGLSLSTPSP